MEWDDYKNKVKNALDLFEFDKEILTILKNSKNNKQKIFVAGNGGSASIAMHYVCDFSKGATKNWGENFNRYKAYCLSTNMGYMTAISNDSNYEEVFRQQLINLADKKDILMLISSSGNSPNIIRAAEFGKALEMIVIGISGFSGGKLKEISDYSAHLNCNSYELCEDIHSIFGHFLSAYLRESE